MTSPTRALALACLLAALASSAHGACYLNEHLDVNNERFRDNRISQPSIDDCARDAENAITKRLKGDSNLRGLSGSYASQRMREVTESYSDGGLDGSFETQWFGDSWSVRYGNVKWTALLDSCWAHDIRTAGKETLDEEGRIRGGGGGEPKRAHQQPILTIPPNTHAHTEGTDQGWGRGRSNDGYCIAQVSFFFGGGGFDGVATMRAGARACVRPPSHFCRAFPFNHPGQLQIQLLHKRSDRLRRRGCQESKGGGRKEETRGGETKKPEQATWRRRRQPAFRPGPAMQCFRALCLRAHVQAQGRLLLVCRPRVWKV